MKTLTESQLKRQAKSKEQMIKSFTPSGLVLGGMSLIMMFVLDFLERPHSESKLWADVMISNYEFVILLGFILIVLPHLLHPILNVIMRRKYS